MTEILILNIHAVKIQNWEEFKASLRLMMPWLQVYDNDKYGRWLVEFWLEINCLQEEKAQHMPDGLFAQSMLGKPYSCLPLDLWIEMTMNKGSKMKAGWLRILKNEQMLLSHVRNANLINRIRVCLHVIANMEETSRCHAKNSTSRLMINEQAVKDLSSCINEFDCDSFDLTKPTLRSLQSEMIASEELVKDFKTANDHGEALVKKFFDVRMFSTEKSFNDTISRNARGNFNRPPAGEIGPKASVSRTAVMENKAMAEVISLVEKCDVKLNLVQIIEYRITEECLSLFNTNRTMVKVQKSKLVEKLNLIPIQTVDSYIATWDFYEDSLRLLLKTERRMMKPISHG